MDLLRGYSATVVSNISHDLSPGWNLVEVGEDIPLETQMISRAPIPAEVLERGSELAQKFGW